MKVNPDDIARAVARGLIAANDVPPEYNSTAEPEKPKLIRSRFQMRGCTPVWDVPCEVPSLANSRDWRTRNRVAQAHRKAVSRAVSGVTLRHLAPYAELAAKGGHVYVTLTRLGGKSLDRTANLPASLKYIEDALCLLMGIDDGLVNWHCRCEQKPGGLCGVRIEITAEV